MHPAYSVIVFTTASGAGYGLLALMAALGSLGLVPAERWLGFAGFAMAFALITAGLLASALHLGRPERAWRALSQWRTSWLSREGVLAVATYIPAGLFAIGWVFFESAWSVLGWLTVVAVIATVYCTGMIYASLKTIRQWHHPLVTPAYLALAFATGALLLNLLLAVFAVDRAWAPWVALAAIALALAIKLAYWAIIDRTEGRYTVGAATGLGRYGAVRPLEAPHSQPNYVMREMGYGIAREHAARLRVLAVLLAFLVPAAFLLPIVFGFGPAAPWASAAVLSAGLGVLIERWLFFAEAQHVVTLYYGAERA